MARVGIAAHLRMEGHPALLMDFGLNETEEMIRSSALQFLEAEAGPKLVRSGEATSFWQQVAELGWPGLAIPEQYGGSEMGLPGLGILMEQWAANLGRGPLFETSVLAAPTIEAGAAETVKREILPRLADGTETAGIAVLEDTAEWSPGAIRTTAVRTNDGWAITGAKHFVSFGDEVDRLLVAARTGEGTEDVTLFVLDRNADGISSEKMLHATGAHVAVLSLNEVTVSFDRIVGEEHRGRLLLEAMAMRGAAFRAVQLAGLGRKVLNVTTAYVKERTQFGAPIGSFQAVQHHLADMAVSVRRVEHLARRAVWSLAEGKPDSELQVSRAKQAASDQIPHVCWTAHQCHGAIGFTEEHDLHLYTRHALAWAAEFGDSAAHADLLASAIGLGEH